MPESERTFEILRELAPSEVPDTKVIYPDYFGALTPKGCEWAIALIVG